MMQCRVCGMSDLIPLWKAHDDHWFRCLCCGSDTSTGVYSAALYGPGFVRRALDDTGGMENARRQLTFNCDWFNLHRDKTNGRDFLDVGCCEGAFLEVMQVSGWSVHGFDVTEEARKEGCTTIAPFFTADLFPRQYHAINCREVIEHVDGVRQFMAELYLACHHHGLIQIQTPRPASNPHPMIYHGAHLQIISPAAMENMVRQIGCEILDRLFWPEGQAWMIRKVNSI